MFIRSLDKPGRENWVPDDTVTNCKACQKAFGVWARKHHCRFCGQIFCDECSKWEAVFVPESRRGEPGYIAKPKRVCEHCLCNIQKARTEQKRSLEEAQKQNEATLAARDKLANFTYISDEDHAQMTTEIEKQDEFLLQLTEHHAKVSGDLTRLEQYLDEDEAPIASTHAVAAPIEDKLGAYLIFDTQQSGTMCLVWSRTEVPEALAFAKPVKAVPDFKFARDGKYELKRNVASTKSNYYLAWCMFVKQVQKFRCTTVDLGIESAPIPSAVWLHYAADNKVQKVLPHVAFTLEGVDCIAAVHSDNNDLEADTLEKNLFLEAGRNHGASITIDTAW